MNCPTCGYRFESVERLECPRCGERVACSEVSCRRCSSCSSPIERLRRVVRDHLAADESDDSEHDER